MGLQYVKLSCLVLCERGAMRTHSVHALNMHDASKQLVAVTLVIQVLVLPLRYQSSVTA